MNQRLEQLIKAEELTSAKFAEILSVQPSSISHLLSGRNKPNFDFISRLLTMFPNVNPRWFINGEGSMYIDENKGLNTPEITENQQDYKRNDTFGSEPFGSSNIQPNTNDNEQISLINNVNNVVIPESEFLPLNEPQSNNFPQNGFKSQNYAENLNFSQVRQQEPSENRAEQNFAENFSYEQNFHRPQSPISPKEQEPLDTAFIPNTEQINRQTQLGETLEQVPSVNPISESLTEVPTEMASSDISAAPIAKPNEVKKEQTPVQEKKIVKVMFFYDDNTFEVFNS